MRIFLSVSIMGIIRLGMKVFCGWMMFILGALSGIMASPCRISGIFLYQRNIDCSIAYYENTLLEAQPRILGAGSSDANGHFSVTFALAQPGIVIFSSLHDDIRVYLQPGDSVHLRVVNRQNIVFSGDRAEENNLLFAEGLSSDIFRSSPNPDRTVEEQVAELLDDWRRRREQIRSKAFAPDFEKFYEAELTGRRYSGIYMAIGPDGSSAYPAYTAMLDSFGTEPLIDESRSRSYNNCFAFLWRSIVAKGMGSQPVSTVPGRDKVWYRDLHDADRVRLLDIVYDKPMLYRMLSYSSLNNVIHGTSDTEVLESLAAFLPALNEELPSDNLTRILREKLSDKIRMVKLQTPYDFTGILPNDSKVSLYDFNAPYILIDFWATWCKPCVESMEKVNTFARDNSPNVLVLAVNIGDTGANWVEFLRESRYPDVRHMKISKAESDKVFDLYCFDSVPHYVLLNEKFEFVVKGMTAFDPDYLAQGMGQRRD